MTLQTLLLWIAVGLTSGWLASVVVGSGVGVVGDIVVGIVGALLGGWLFRTLGISTPFHGVAATVFTAFIGAIVLLVLLRAVRSSRAGVPR
jgi:uncharacterized membrane protein YeaQ/YmgE (transglycosylase-associated protein family)